MRAEPKYEVGELLLKKFDDRWRRVWVECVWTLNSGPEPVAIVEVRFEGGGMHVVKDRVDVLRAPLFKEAAEELLLAMRTPQPEGEATLIAHLNRGVRAIHEDDLLRAVVLLGEVNARQATRPLTHNEGQVLSALLEPLVEEISAALELEPAEVEPLALANLQVALGK